MNDDIQILSRNLCILRKYHRLTQKEMASILGISVTSLRKLEHGILPHRLTIDFLFALNAHFHIPIDTLFSEIFPFP